MSAPTTTAVCACTHAEDDHSDAGTRRCLNTTPLRPVCPCLRYQPYAGPSVVHATPPPSSGLTPCCRRPPFELPRTDRMTNDGAAVTCSTSTK